jgi:hypothetical protein
VRASLGVEYPPYAIGAARTRSQAIDGFRRKDDQLPFGQRLHGAMDDVAAIFSLTEIDDDGGHIFKQSRRGVGS